MKNIFNLYLHQCLFAVLVLCALMVTGQAFAQDTSQVPPYPNDLSPAGLQAAMSEGDSTLAPFLPPEFFDRLREYVKETQRSGLSSRTGSLSVSAVPANVHVNNNAGDRIGETQAEVAVAVFGDTVVIGFNDSRGFTVGTSPGVGTLSGFGYSVNGGATFTDGGTTPVALSTDFCFGDPGVDTDEKGNWYYNQIYTRTGQQNIGVHHGKFVAGVLVWDSPVQADVAVTSNSSMDKCLLACDRVTGNVYVAATRFSSIGLPPRIEIVRSTNNGASWDPPVVLDNTITPTSSKQGARPFCGPNGEVYVVWEKGANSINCPDGSGNVASFNGAQIAFTRSLNNGVSYDPFTVIASLTTDFMASGPGDLRERANEFPDIAVDRSGGPFNGNLYVTWHESAPWTSNLSAGPVRAEAANVANNNPGGAELFLIGENVTGSSSSTADLDYWQFSATQGQNLLFNLDPQNFNCGVTGTTRGMRMRLFATQSPYPNPNGFPDTLVAASAQGTFADRIVWTAPKTGTYLVRLQPSTTAIGTYTLRVRNLAFGAPSPARDARDVVVVRSTNQGAAWSAKQLVNDDPAGLENRRPFIAVDGLGRVHVFWHDSRLPGFGSNAALTSIFGTSSTDGGNSWSPNYMVTDELSFFSFNTIAVPNLGDYNQAAATSSGLAHPAWSDQRLSTGDVRVPNSNAFSAGFGPETYTTALSPPVITCPANITQSNDPGSCSAVVTYSVSASGTPAPTVTCTPPSGNSFPIGTTTVNCTATNGIGNSASCSFTVTVNDAEAPVVTCPASIIANTAPGVCTAVVTYSATATDNCPGVTVSCSPPSGTTFSLGTTTVTCTATDAASNTSSCAFSVTVIDNHPPTISLSLNPSKLWPPNHTLIDIAATVTVSDNCPGTTFVLTSITSNEPDNGLGDGDTAGDIQDASYGTADVAFKVRSERAGGGSGRVYTVTYTATDIGGNSTTATATVTVPHDQRKNLGIKDPTVSLKPLVPDEFVLNQNHPNPFNPTTTISYGVPFDAIVNLAVYDVLGRNVAQLVDGRVSAGFKEVQFDASALPSGLYLYRMTAIGDDAASVTLTRKLMLMK